MGKGKAIRRREANFARAHQVCDLPAGSPHSTGLVLTWLYLLLQAPGGSLPPAPKTSAQADTRYLPRSLKRLLEAKASPHSCFQALLHNPASEVFTNAGGCGWQAQAHSAATALRAGSRDSPPSRTSRQGASRGSQGICQGRRQAATACAGTTTGQQTDAGGARTVSESQKGQGEGEAAALAAVGAAGGR